MGSPSKTYLDYAAQAPLRREAQQAILDYLAEPWSKANPNSLHSLGRGAARALDGARAALAEALGSGLTARDIAFCGGGTEANNIAVMGMAEGARARDRRRCRVILSAIEHDSVLDLAPALRGRGLTVDIVAPTREGLVEPQALAALLGDDVALVSVMTANNETGVTQPVAELAGLSHEAGALFHTDAIQALGHIQCDFGEADCVTVAAHKLGGPTGVGAMALRTRVPFAPQVFGGGQERGRRPGTQDVVGAVGFAAVASLLERDLAETARRVSGRARRLLERLLAVEGVVATSPVPYDGASRLPGIVSLCVEGLDSETLVLGFDDRGFEVSAGSACSSTSLGASHVLRAMGIPEDLALGSLRISFDERVEPSTLSAFSLEFAALVERQRGRAS